MDIATRVLKWIIGLFPDDPFKDVWLALEDGSEWWGYVNYFIPVNQILAVATVWASCMVLYKAIGFVTQILKKVGAGG